MPYRRFYAPPEAIQKDTVLFTPEESHHMKAVVRLKVGDIVEVFDGAGGEYRCRLESLQAIAQARILETIATGAESPLKLTLLQSLTKLDKFDYIVQKATELGVTQIIPVVSARSEVRWTEAKAAARVERWQKIAAEAVKQCRRSVVPWVRPVIPLERALPSLNAGDSICRLCLSERQGVALRQALPANAPQECVILVGPEGGWSDDDLAVAAANRYQMVALGPRVLRTETAALVALSILQFHYGDLGRS